MESNESQEPDPASDVKNNDAVAEPLPGSEAAFKTDLQTEPEEPFILTTSGYSPDSADERARKIGLAWSAGIVFFGSVAFTLFLGWGADLLLGSSPWGLVGGIVLGSVIGFVQFFRISSQIFNNSGPKSGPRSLFDERDDDPKE
jgi:F0F1-type ATP synthase assembly protein I